MIYKGKATIRKQNRQFATAKGSKQLSESKLPHSQSRNRNCVEMPSGKPPAWKASAHVSKFHDFFPTKFESPTSNKSHETQTPESVLL